MSNALFLADPDPSIEEQSEHWRFDESEGGISLAAPWKAEIYMYPTTPYRFGALDHASGGRRYPGGVYPAATTEVMDFLNGKCPVGIALRDVADNGGNVFGVVEYSGAISARSGFRRGLGRCCY